MPNMKRRRFFHKVYERIVPAPMSEEEGIEKIVNMLEAKSPCMISRFGSTELQTLSYIKMFPLLLPLKKRTYHNIRYCSGFFPVTLDNLRRFYKIYKDDVKEQLDILISWRFEEFFFKKWIGNRPRISKTTLDHFFEQKTPWTRVLRGKKVLVVHPFAETIMEQYTNNREHLFSNPDVLPEFAELHVIKAVQSIAGNPVDFGSWFDALDYMKSEINKIDFDIAILGCGAYGMPLAAHIKRIGKKAIHMGGVTQILFGIKGKIYVENPVYATYINSYFVYPDDKDTPANAKVVEGGCYWK